MRLSLAEAMELNWTADSSIATGAHLGEAAA